MDIFSKTIKTNTEINPSGPLCFYNERKFDGLSQWFFQWTSLGLFYFIFFFSTVNSNHWLCKKIAKSNLLCQLSHKHCSIVNVYIPNLFDVRSDVWPIYSSPVWPDKNLQMSIKVAQKWFHSKNGWFWYLYKNCLRW